MESGLRKVWSEGGASKVKKEAVERLQAAGWKDAAPALRMTVWYRDSLVLFKSGLLSLTFLFM
jgi:hypothetical protein